MAKTSGPLMSLEAHGSIGKAITFSKRQSGQITRQFHYPKKDPTQAQLTQRFIISVNEAVERCRQDRDAKTHRVNLHPPKRWGIG